MRLVILGSGNLAWALVRALARLSEKDGSIRLVQIYSRNKEEGEKLSELAGSSYSDSPETLAAADLYIMAVADGAIAKLSERMNVPAGAVVVHTAGSTGIEAISPRLGNRGVIYPLQTFTKGRDIDFSSVPLFIEFSTPRAGEIIRSAAGGLSGHVSEVSSEIRVKVHLAAVFAANFTNHMYTIAEEILKESGFTFETAKPLIAEVAAKAVASASPVSVQTGPAARGDKAAIDRHLELLGRRKSDPEELAELQKEIYETISQSIWETLKKK